ncbi:Peroxisome biosynthesis protein pex1 [Schaereria dolodes]|nr:Peroxisome biosynthesis protein pex1 [Schaereria dolodes]
MVLASRKGVLTAELALIQLRNCLINLPPSLVEILVNANATAQNVVVELQYRTEDFSAVSAKEVNSKYAQQSLYVGWTGMPSQRKPVNLNGKGSIRNHSSRGQEVQVVEIDATFGRTIGLAEGQKVGVVLHLDPPSAHTVNIEPLTPGDWEIIELHATFLELNLLSQIRVLPNPLFSDSPSGQVQQGHPLTLHLSPTSTANIIVSSLLPTLPTSSPYAKLAPDAEVIVAPKTRARTSRDGRTESRSMTSTSRRSAGGRSGTGAIRQESHRGEVFARRAVFLRGLDRGICTEWFDDQDEVAQDDGLKIWLGADVLASKDLRGTEWVCVSVMKPASLQPPLDSQEVQNTKAHESSDSGRPVSKVVARVQCWNDAPDSRHVVLSSSLCACLESGGIIGGLVRVEAAPVCTQNKDIKGLKIYPFLPKGVRQSDGLRFGGEIKPSREVATAGLRAIDGNKEHGHASILNGPLTDGMMLNNTTDLDPRGEWNAGIFRIDPPAIIQDGEKAKCRWILGREVGMTIEVHQAITKPLTNISSLNTEPDLLPSHMPSLVGIDALISKLMSHLSHHSPVLLNGGLGSGKTSLAQLLAHRLRREKLYHTTYFSCRKLVADEARVSTIKETVNRLLMAASWGSRMGGSALVILDDLDKICPVETELQIGGDNGRSRQVSELLCSSVRQYCAMGSGVVLLATSQSKEALNSIIIGSHIIREIIDLKAPDKDTRRQVLQKLSHVESRSGSITKSIVEPSSTRGAGEDTAWTDESSPNSYGQGVFSCSDDLDLLDIAGQTDGYMPGDLVLLLSRARSEALIRSIVSEPELRGMDGIQTSTEDFQKAIKGFTPASLRNVVLHSSTTTFDSIGGLHATRKILLETLQYPTTYGPIFAQCPLRLRSGLLLYGYPGCGKTLLASAVAGECGLNFISVKGPEILNKYIGASEKSVRDLFERAEAARPCVLFFDEFDSIAPKRGHDSTGVTDRVVNQLLTQMDGAEGLSGVYVLAATSRPDLIDPALLRPGRLDKSLICDLPDIDDRIDILQALSKKLTISPEILGTTRSQENLAEIALRTEGYSGADLQAIIYNAHLEAIHDVLGHHKGTTQLSGERVHDKNKARSVHGKEIITFRYGEEEERKEAAERATSGVNHSKQIAANAAIAAKLDSIKLAQRKERQQHRGGTDDRSAFHSKQAKDGRADGNQEVMIQWKHIEASLASTRCSIGQDERRRLGGIYREFVVGRNGEMPSGQGPRDVGGRSSLM